MAGPMKAWWRLWPLTVLLGGVALSSCWCNNTELPDPPTECDADGVGCLPDEQCVEGKCVLLDKCEADEDCPTTAYRCTFPAQVCELRPGFGLECEDTTQCDPGSYCALGVCHPIEGARQCGRRTDCPLGQACSQLHYVCIEEGPCTVADDFPELACEPGEVCDPVSERCQLECQEECTTATAEQDCGVGMLCDGACRCVQCITDGDCGLGLVCNERAGRCESENLCFDDSDCEEPLICDPHTALCQVAPPACESDFDCAVAEICNRITGVCELPGGACIDDRFEDADTPALAKPITLPVDGAELIVDELQLCPDDDDVYAFTLAAGDNLVVSVVGTAALAQATVWLLDPEGETSLRFAQTPPYGDGTINYVAQQDETVFLRVNALLGPSPYDMIVRVNPGQVCADDDYEGDSGNDTPGTATPEGSYPLGAPLTAVVCPEDVDAFAVALDEGEGITAHLAFDPTFTDLDVFVKDATSGAVLAQSAGVFQPETLRWRTTFARDVVVEVRGFGNDNGAYELTVERLPALVCVADGDEPDNTPANAIVLGAGQEVIGAARTLCKNDIDSYRLEVLDFERVVARTAFASADLDLVVKVLDSTGTTLLAQSPPSSGNETVTYAPGADQEVLVQVESLFNTAAPYTLDLFRENVLDCDPDPLEPNNTALVAVPVPDPVPELSICDSDQDFFLVDGVAGKKLVARVTFLHADGDLDLMILGLGGTQVLASSDGIGNVEQAEAILPLDGTYTVRVFSLTNGAAARYNLELSLVTP